MVDQDRNATGSQRTDGIKRLLLVVDGDGAYLYYTGILLQRLEYTLHTTKTAEEALELIGIALPSLILTEAELPRMSGVDFLKQLKQNAKTQTIPAIVYSLSGDPALRQTCLNEGAAAFLKKPIDPDLLYAAIQKATETTPRGYVRLTTCLNVVVGEMKNNALSSEDRITALSEHGVYVSTMQPRPKGELVPLTFQLEDVAITVNGRVLYSFDRSTSPLRSPGMGVQFTRIRSQDQEMIKSFIEKQLTRDLPKPVRGRNG